MGFVVSVLHLKLSKTFIIPVNQNNAFMIFIYIYLFNSSCCNFILYIFIYFN